jgi:hypothetical protein
VDNIGDSIAWPSRDPQWLQKVLVIGLISIIPVVGSMVAYGWLLGALDNLRAGRQELPPADFRHLNRGAGLWLVLLVWGLIVVVAAVIFFVLGGVFTSLGSSQDSGPATALGAVFFLMGWLAVIAGSLVIIFLEIPIILATDRGGIGAGLNFAAVFRTATDHLNQTLVAGLMNIVASVIASIGTIACVVGALFTGAYAYAVIAGIASHYERAISQTTQPPAAPAN